MDAVAPSEKCTYINAFTYHGCRVCEFDCKSVHVGQRSRRTPATSVHNRDCRPAFKASCKITPSFGICHGTRDHHNGRPTWVAIDVHGHPAVPNRDSFL